MADIQAGDHIGKYEVVEVVTDFWAPGQDALILNEFGEAPADATVWARVRVKEK